MIKFLLLLLVFFVSTNIYTQEIHIRKLTTEQIEDLFLSNNLELLAAHVNIDIADAAIVQAKLLNNPTIVVGQVNFWNSGAEEEFNSSSSAFGRNIQFSLELNQIIRTAGKRRKLVDLEKVSKEIIIQEFELLLLNLRTELRKILNEVMYLQAYQQIIGLQQESMGLLVDSYKIQTEKGNISKTEILRLQSSIIESESEINEIQVELNRHYKELKILLNIPMGIEIEIVEDNRDPKKPDEILLSELFEKAKAFKPEYILSDLNTKHGKNLIIYEKSHRIPDLSISASYDRYGGVWNNFVGFGIGIDIPIFNRNQGNIKAAKLNLEQSNYYADQNKNIIQQEIIELYKNYLLNYDFYMKLVDNNFYDDMKNMLEVYTRNLLNKNISMFEYIDFMDAYKANMQTILDSKKKMNISFAELQFCVNNDLK